ncbi:hypothetical protein LBMAG57_09180 [Verrucomicrobiota bacterium]|nr:hypothetical protein LBMAG57_09180 [Verrucomicrobiota bacterium]
MTPQQKAESLGPKFQKIAPGYLNLCNRSGSQLLTSGHVSDLKGKLGADLAEGYAAAKNCAKKSSAQSGTRTARSTACASSKSSAA